MKNRITIEVADLSQGKTDATKDLTPVSVKYKVKAGKKVLSSNTFSTNFSGRSLRRLKKAEMSGKFMDIERRLYRRAVESLLIYLASATSFLGGNVVKVKCKRSIVPLRKEIVNVISDSIDTDFFIE